MAMFNEKHFSLKLTPAQALWAKTLHDGCVWLHTRLGLDGKELYAWLLKSYYKHDIEHLLNVNMFASDSIVEVTETGLDIYTDDTVNCEFIGYWMQAVMCRFDIPNAFVFEWEDCTINRDTDTRYGISLCVTKDDVKIQAHQLKGTDFVIAKLD